MLFFLRLFSALESEIEFETSELLYVYLTCFCSMDMTVFTVVSFHSGGAQLAC